MILVYGQQVYGAADRTAIDGHVDHAETTFVHLYGVPMVPVVSRWQRDGVAVEIAPHLGNIAAVYARWWGLIAAALVGMAAVVLSPWCVLGLVPCAAAIWRGFRRPSPPTARELRRGAFAIAIYGNRCPLHLVLPATRARLALALAARWPAVGGGRAPEDVARLGARNLAEAAHAYMMLVFASLVARGADARSLAAAADRILDGAVDAVEGGPFRAGELGAEHAGVELPALSLSPPVVTHAPRIAPPPSRVERGIVRTFWWGIGALTMIGGTILFARALAPARHVTASAVLAPASDGDRVAIRCDRVTPIDRTVDKYQLARCVTRDEPSIQLAYADPVLPPAGDVYGVVDGTRLVVETTSTRIVAMIGPLVLALAFPAILAWRLHRLRRARRATS